MSEPLHEGAVNSDVRRERTDASAAALIVFGICLVAVAVITHLALLSYLRWLEAQRAAEMPAPPPIAGTRARLPRDIDRIPAPRLQVSDQMDMEQLRERDRRILQGGRWTDAQGKMHTLIPIDAALKAMSDPAFAARHGLRFQDAKRDER